jgi:hypothetical protein
MVPNPTDAFTALKTFLERFDALDFLCQAAMTNLFSAEGTFHSESDEVQLWGRRLEFAAGYYAAHGSAKHEVVDGWRIEEFKTLIDDYYNSLDIARLHKKKDKETEPFTVTSAQIHSMHVRGEAYRHQFEEYARELYGAHDEWFKEKLGFTIRDAYSLAESMSKEMDDRFNRRSKDAIANANTLVRDDLSWKEAGITKRDATSRAAIHLFYGKAKEIFGFTEAELVRVSGLDSTICSALLKRLSQKPPFRNAQYPDTFTTSDASPWDYNTISERAILTDGDRFWLPIPHLLFQSLYYTFYFDLMGDSAYGDIFGKARGVYLENKTAEYLKRIFPSSTVLLNPYYPKSNEEFADILVLFDGKIIVVQCKGKPLTRNARIGASATALASDVQKAIKNAIDQSARCRLYLERDDKAVLIHDGIELTIDMTAVTSIDLMAVTFMPLHMMATRIREVEEDLGLSHARYEAWALALGDLDVVTDICDSPARFFQYINRRLLLEKGTIRVHGDEMDLLAFFLTQGLWMQDEQFKNTNLVAIAGFSNEVDEYIFRKWDTLSEVSKPRVPRPKGFDELVRAVESLPHFHRTDCAIALLEVSGVFSVQLMDVIATAKNRTLQDGKPHSVTLQSEEGLTGISFQAFPQSTSSEEVLNRTEGFGVIKKYAEKLNSWAAFSWQVGSTSSADHAFWVSFPWTHEESLEPIVAKMRKSGTPLRVKL